MITIKIDKSIKCYEEKSLFVSFPYNAKIVEIIKSQKERYYNPINKTWELPYSDLNTLRQQLKSYDIDILNYYENCHTDDLIEKTYTYIPKDYKFKISPFKHQIEGIEYGLNHDRFILADEQGCISGDCKVQVKCPNDVATMRMKLKNLYNNFNNQDTRFYKNMLIKCLVNGRFRYYKIKNVLYTGKKETIKLYCNNKYISCTPDHLIYTPNGWIEAKDIKENDIVFTNGIECCPMCGSTENLVTYPYAKYKGYCHNCVNKWLKDGRKYKGNQIAKKLNDDGYVVLRGKPLRKRKNYKDGILEHIYVMEEKLGYEIDTNIYVVHHKNGIKTDNKIENLQLLTKSEHAKLHSDTKMFSLPQYNSNITEIKRGNTIINLCPKESKITKIEKDIIQDVYDIQLDENEGIHNYVCNNFIVHNCGKTAQAIHIAILKKQQKNYKHCLIICGVNGLKWNWQNEIEKHSNEKGYILGTRQDKKGNEYIGTVNDRLEDLRVYADNTFVNENINNSYFIITNIETIRNEQIINELKALCELNVINMIVVDEFHHRSVKMLKVSKAKHYCN